MQLPKSQDYEYVLGITYKVWMVKTSQAEKSLQELQYLHKLLDNVFSHLGDTIPTP